MPGRQASARAASGFRPRHTMSALRVKTGPGPSSGRAWRRPPPVSSRSGSWETRASGATRARWSATCPAWACVLTTIRGTPAPRARASAWSRSGRPATGMSGFGRSRVSAPMRVPSPAAKIIAAKGPLVGAVIRAPDPRENRRLRRRDVAGDEGVQRGEAGMGEVAGEMRPDPRQVGEIPRLAVAAAEPGEEAEDLEVALGREGGGGKQERRAVGAGAREIAVGQRRAQRSGHVAAGVLEQRDEVVGRMTVEHVLEVEEADPRRPVPPREPEQVLGVVVAQHRRGADVGDRRQRRAAERVVLGDERRARARRRWRRAGTIPAPGRPRASGRRGRRAAASSPRTAAGGAGCRPARRRRRHRARPRARAPRRRAGRRGRRRDPRAARARPRDRRRGSRAR